MKPKICAWCGESWTPQRKETRTCSYGCGAKLREVEKPSKGHKREYPPEIVALATTAYVAGKTVREVQELLPSGFRAQTIIERHLAERRRTGKRHQAGPANHAWKGDSAGYEAAHWRVKSLRGSASIHACCDCSGQAMDWSYEGGCEREARDGETGCAYSPNPDMYSPRCRSCHRQYDAARRKAIQ